MSGRRTAREIAEASVAAARDNPAERLRLAAQTLECGTCTPDSRWRFARSELAFLRSLVARGVLGGPGRASPGSPWWCAVNDRLLSDTLEATLLAGGAAGGSSATSVDLWLAFIDRPSAASWYRAHNASIVGAYLEHESLAKRELLVERFFLNVALVRVLYAHALAAAPRLALGRLAPLSRLVSDPRGGMVDLFLSIRRVFPEHYPLTGLTLQDFLAVHHRLFRAMDYGVIVPRIGALYAFTAESLGETRVHQLVRDGVRPTYGRRTRASRG